jgi:hypothetical protein
MGIGFGHVSRRGKSRVYNLSIKQSLSIRIQNGISGVLKSRNRAGEKSLAYFRE